MQRFYRGQIRLAVEAQLCMCTARASRHSVESFRPPPPAYEASVRPGDGVDRMMRQVQENHSLNNRQWGSAIRDRFTKLLTTKPDPAC